MHQDNLVSAGANKFQRFQKSIEINEAIREDHEQSPAIHASNHLVESSWQDSIVCGIGTAECAEQCVEVRRRRARWNETRFRERRNGQSYRVALTQQQSGETRTCSPGIGELRLRAHAEIHRAAAIKHEQGIQIGLFFELFDVITVALRKHFPVQQSHLIARTVGAMLGEFRAAALHPRAVLSR